MKKRKKIEIFKSIERIITLIYQSLLNKRMSVTKNNSNANCGATDDGCVSSKPKSLSSWFIENIKKGLSEIHAYSMASREINHKITMNDDLKSSNDINILQKESRQIHFNLIRRITELFYVINTYFEDAYIEMPSVLSLTTIIKMKIVELYADTNFVSSYKPITKDEKRCLNEFNQTLEEANRLFIKSASPIGKKSSSNDLTTETSHKRLRRGKCVDYTGMDTNSEDDDIASNIRYDLTTKDDPDYVPDEEEDDEYETEEDDEDYVPDEEEDDEYETDEEDEDDGDEEDTLLRNLNKKRCQIYVDEEAIVTAVKVGNHTRFIYN